MPRKVALIPVPFAADGDRLAGVGISKQRGKFLEDMPPLSLTALNGDISWWMNKAAVGRPTAAGGNTTLFNMGDNFKIGGLATDTGHRDTTGYYMRPDRSIGVKIGVSASADSETNLNQPRVYAWKPGKVIKHFFRGGLSAVAVDFLWGMASDNGDALDLLDAAGAENITDGVVFHKTEAETSTFTLSLVATGTAVVNQVVTLNGALAAIGSGAPNLFELGWIITGVGDVFYYANHDYTKPELGVYGTLSSATVAGVVGALLAMGPSVAVGGNNEYGDADLWGALLKDAA